MTPEEAKAAAETTPQVWPSFIMFCIAAAGGAVSWWGKMKKGEVKPVNMMELVGEIVASGITGVLVAWLMTGLGVNQFLVFAAAGISGHMGTRAIFLIERYAERKFFPTEEKKQ